MAETEDYDKSAIPTAHKTSHQDGGSDEISVLGLSGLLGDSQTPLAHKTSHQDGGADEISIAGLLGTPQSMTDHLAASDPHAQYALLAGRSGGQTLIGGTAITDILKLQGTSGAGTLTSPAIQLLVGNAGATVAMTVLNNGNVGIGTTGPGYKLTVEGTGVSEANVFAVRNSENAAYAPYLIVNTGSGADDYQADRAGFDGYVLALGTRGGSGNYKSLAAAGQVVLATEQGSVGIGMNPTYKLDITGNLRCSTGFGCNGTTPQTAYASGGALAAYATGAFGLNSDANMAALHALVVKMRAALVANGIMS